MQCIASGDHPMTIVWNIDKQPLNPSEDLRYKLNEHVDKKRLTSEITIMSAERRDSALFTCLVTNAFGRDDMNIRLIVQEPPEPPREIKILEQKSRSAKISWSQPFSGNSAINKYVIQCKPESAKGNWENIQNITTGGDDTKVILKGLRPARTYYCRVRAENSVGLGEPSEPTAITTPEEVPGGPPLDVKVQAIDSQSLKVTWKPPDVELWNGPIKGYYVGYKIYDSEDPYLYKTLEVGQGIEEQVVLNQLQKFTRYSVLVQAYNSMGAGPRSDEIIVRTLEDVPSQPPHRVQCLPLTSQSLHVLWEAPPITSIHGILQGYKVLYRPAETLAGDEEYEEKRVTERDTKLTSLQKYTNYSIMVVAYTQKGYGVRSNPVYCMTLEDVPGPPAAVKAIAFSSDTFLVMWTPPLLSSGVINKYSLYWRTLSSDVKNASVVRIPANQHQYKVTGLKDNSRHEFWVTASTARGEGEISKIVSGTTTSWLPARILGFGEAVVTTPGEKVVLSCQAVGNPVQRNWKFRGEPLPKHSRMEVLSGGALIIRQLQITDSGNYSCFVRNKHGSDEVTYALLIQEPVTSHSPQIKIISTSTSSVHVDFLFTMPENVILRGYEVHYKAEGKEWQQRRISGKNHTFQLDGLDCGTSYQLYVIPLTNEGKGDRSNPVVFRTESTEPVAPKQEEMIFTNTTHLVLQLLSWQSNVCPITRMIIEYRPQTSTRWTLLTNRAVPEQQNQIIIPDLNPEMWYVIRVTAHNAGGSTVTEYDVITMKVSAAVPASDAGSQGHGPSTSSFFEDTTTLVSMASSGVVLIAGVVAVVCLVMYKRRRNTRHHYRESSSRSDVATTTALMAHLEKKSQRSETSRQSHSHSRDLPSYFSSPVRKVVPTTNPPSSRQLPHSSSSSHYYEDEIAPYATFQLPGPTPEEEDGQTEEFKTFSVHHGEPPYLAKTSLDPPSAKSGKASEELYQSQAPNSHSLTSGSSNQEELMRAYEYARRHPPPALQYDGVHNRGQSHTSGTGTTESEGTDPGIRQFSGTPPKPNERRQGACLTPGVSVGASPQTGNESSTSDEATPVNTPYQARPMPSAQPREKGQLSWGGIKNRNQSTCKKINSKGIKKGLSSDESDSEGTIYTFSRADTVVLRGSSGNEISEAECDRDRISHLNRSNFSRRPPVRSHTKSDIIDC